MKYFFLAEEEEGEEEEEEELGLRYAWNILDGAEE
jgi:hypothetical protein